MSACPQCGGTVFLRRSFYSGRMDERLWLLSSGAVATLCHQLRKPDPIQPKTMRCLHCSQRMINPDYRPA
jgi:hypothetical protein